MTTYQGGKKRLGKQIHDAIVELEQKLYDTKLPYLEPFIGMGSVMAQFGKDGDGRKLSGCDLNESVNEMWKALQSGWEPPLEISKEYYMELKRQKDNTPECGFVGSACSFGGQFFMGYKSKYDNDCKQTVSKTNYAEIGWRSIQKVLPHMMKVNILDSQSYECHNPEGMLIYCDPPYKNNQLHTPFFQNFDNDKFWELMREWSKTNLVIISELTAPDDFLPIWSKDYKVSFMKHKVNLVRNFTERLFVHNLTVSKKL